MKIAPDYLASLPKWVSETLIERATDKLFDARFDDVKEYVGDYDTRIMWNNGDPVLILFDDDDKMNLMRQEVTGEIMLYSDCWLSGYSSTNTEPMDNDEVTMEIQMQR